MKTLAIISIIGSVFLSGCAHYGYQRNYVGYGGGYDSGYRTYGGYSYPSSSSYGYRDDHAHPRAYSSPWHNHDRRHDWSTSRQDRYNDIGNMERRMDRQQHAIRQGVRSGDLTRREAERLQQDVQRMDRKLDRIQRRPIASQMQRTQLEHDLNRSQERIREFKANALTRDGRGHYDRAGRDGRERWDRNR